MYNSIALTHQYDKIVTIIFNRQRKEEEENKKLGIKKEDEEDEDDDDDIVDGANPFKRLDSEEIQRKVNIFWWTVITVIVECGSLIV